VADIYYSELSNNIINTIMSYNNATQDVDLFNTDTDLTDLSIYDINVTVDSTNSLTDVTYLRFCRYFEFSMTTCVIGVFGLVGLVMNAIAVRVLRKDQRNKVPAYLLQVLAAADMAVLVMMIFVMSMFVGPSQIPSVYKYTRYITTILVTNNLIPFF